jgi:hypothetical protein
MLNITINPIMLSAVILSAVYSLALRPSVVVLNVVMLNVAAPSTWACHWVFNQLNKIQSCYSQNYLSLFRHNLGGWALSSESSGLFK